MSNKILLGLGVLVVALLLTVFVMKDKFSSRNATSVAVEKVEKRSITETVSTNGKIYPVKEVKLSVEVPGEVTKINVAEGDSVNKGDLLLEINPSTFISSVSRSNAAYKQAQANQASASARLSQANSQFDVISKDYNRKVDLLEKGVISSFEFEQTEASYLSSTGEKEAAAQNVQAAKYQVESALATLGEANENLSRTKLFAPINGIVSKLNVELGEKVVGTGQMAGTELITVADLGQMELQVDVGENDVLRISIGDTAEIEVDAYLDETFTGIVTHIAYSSNYGIDQQITKFQVKIKILPESYAALVQPEKGHAYPFRPGMSAVADILTESINDVITVPIQSVTLRKDEAAESKGKEEKLQVVFVVEDGKAVMKEVKTGVQDDQYIEVTGGLDEGEEVVTGPFRAISKDLSNDDEVVVVSEEELFSSEK